MEPSNQREKLDKSFNESFSTGQYGDGSGSGIDTVSGSGIGSGSGCGFGWRDGAGYGDIFSHVTGSGKVIGASSGSGYGSGEGDEDRSGCGFP